MIVQFDISCRLLEFRCPLFLLVKAVSVEVCCHGSAVLSPKVNHQLRLSFF